MGERCRTELLFVIAAVDVFDSHGLSARWASCGRNFVLDDVEQWLGEPVCGIALPLEMCNETEENAEVEW
jgi:hypothetical protein